MITPLTRRDGQSRLAIASDPVDAGLTAAAAAIAAVDRAQVRAAVEVLLEATRTGRRVYMIGNGGSAATASHMAVDLAKQANVDGHPAVRAIALTDNMPLVTAWANDESFDLSFARQLEVHLEAGDVLVAISTSGASPNVLRAAELARARGATVVAFTGDSGGDLKGLAHVCVFVPYPDVGMQEVAHLAIDHTIAVAIQARLRAL